MSETPAIIARNLSKAYKLYSSPRDRLKEALSPLRRSYHRDFYALRDISFEIPRGTTVAIIGRNGSGKSTLLKLITGVLAPTTGAVTVNGRIAAMLELGAGFNPELTGLENIFLYGSVLGYTRADMEKRLGDIIAFAEIDRFIEQPVKLYSSGMFARLAFATHIHVDPEILIVDEVLAVGDIRFQLKCRDRLNEMRDRGVTILYVSHGNAGIGDEAIMLERGEIVQRGPLLDVWNHYHRMMTDTGDDASPAFNAPPAERPSPGEQRDQGDNGHAPVEPGLTEIHLSTHYDREPEAVEEALHFRESAEFLARVEERRFGTGEVRFVNTELVDEHGQGVGAARWGQTLYYRIHLRVDRDVPFLSTGFQVRNSTALYIMGDESWGRRVPMLDLHAGDRLVLEFRFTVNLYPGEYTLTPGCSYRNVELKGEVQYFDWIDNCDVLRVVPGRRPIYSIYYVPMDTAVRIDRASGRVPEDLPALIRYYEQQSIPPW